METLDAKLNGIARRHGIPVPDDDAKPKLRTPTPVHKEICSECANGPALVAGLCEPCHREHVAMPLLRKRDALYKALSDLDMQIVRAEAQVKSAKVLYNRALKQNWKCSNCLHVFGYYGDLFEHEPQCKQTTAKVRATPMQRRASRRDEDIA